MNRLPAHVDIREVGPRDGFQNEPETIATADKIDLINQLARTGLRRIEVASFVRPDVIPQLSDGVEVLRGIDVPEYVSLMVLVPNSKGLDNALKVRETFSEVAIFVSASETHNKKNVNRSIAESMADNEVIAKRIVAEDLRCAAVIATSYGCPFEGKVPMKRVLDIAEQFAAAGASEVGFGDTTGMANPAYVGEFFAAAIERLPGVEVTAHFHNTRGQGLANAYAALQAGCTSFESSFGELGGCPVPAGSDRKHRLGGSDQHVRGDGRVHRGIAAGLDRCGPRRPKRARPQTDQPLHRRRSDRLGTKPGRSVLPLSHPSHSKERTDMTNRVAFVTGGAQGIGQGISETLGANGFRVAVADLNLEAAEATAKRIAECRRRSHRGPRRCHRHRLGARRGQDRRRRARGHRDRGQQRRLGRLHAVPENLRGLLGQDP